MEKSQLKSPPTRGVDQLMSRMARIDPDDLSRMSSEQLNQMLHEVEEAKRDLVRSIPEEVLRAAQTAINPEQLQEILASFDPSALHGLDAHDIMQFARSS